MKKLDELSRIDSSLSQVSQMLDPAKITIQEASYTLRDYLSQAGRQSGAPGRDRDAPGRARSVEAQVRRHAGGSAGVPGRGAVATSPAWRRPTNARRRWRRSARRSAKDYERLSAQLTGERRKAAAALVAARRRGAETAGHGPHGFRGARVAGGVERTRRRCRGVPGVAERRGNAAAAREGGVGRRVVAHRAGAEDVLRGVARRRPTGRERWSSTRWIRESAAARPKASEGG